MIESIIGNLTANPSRDALTVATQHVLTILIPFYIGCRPSSLAPTHKTFADLGYVRHTSPPRPFTTQS